MDRTATPAGETSGTGIEAGRVHADSTAEERGSRPPTRGEAGRGREWTKRVASQNPRGEPAYGHARIGMVPTWPYRDRGLSGRFSKEILRKEVIQPQFGPPRPVKAASTCPWVVHLLSRLLRPTLSPCSDSVSLRLPP